MDSSHAMPQDDGYRAEPAVIESIGEVIGSAAILRGTARGLEIVINGRASAEAIAAAVGKRLDDAPSFFRGSDVRIRVEHGPLAGGCLGRLDALAGQFELRIVEVVAVVASRPGAAEGDAVPKPSLAAGSAPSATTGFEDEPTGSGLRSFPLALALAGAQSLGGLPVAIPLMSQLRGEPVTLPEAEVVEVVELADEAVTFEEPTQTAVPIQLAATPEIELETVSTGTRLVVGPVRSGVILEHAGHLVVFGDVNPGAEIRARGNIVVLGRLRGTAHAGIGEDVGFILALRLEPQQLRIGRKVARAADSDTPASEAEIASCTGDAIVVERYLGKLPRNLATSL